MAEERKRRSKRAYLDDFHKNSKGTYEYRGKTFRCENGSEVFARTKQKMLGTGIIAFVCALAAGCIPAPGMTGTVYMILPYVFGLISMISLGWALCRLWRSELMLREYIYESTVKKIPQRSMLTAILNLAAALGGLVYLLTAGTGSGILWSAAFCLLEMITGGSGIVIFRMAGELRWQEELTVRGQDESA